MGQQVTLERKCQLRCMAKKILKEIKCPDALLRVKKNILHFFVMDIGLPCSEKPMSTTYPKHTCFVVCLHTS